MRFRDQSSVRILAVFLILEVILVNLWIGFAAFGEAPRWLVEAMGFGFIGIVFLMGLSLVVFGVKMALAWRRSSYDDP